MQQLLTFLFFFWPQPTEAKRSCGAPRATHNLAPNWQIVFTTNCSPSPSPTAPCPRPTPALLACQIEARCQNTKQNETYRNRGQRSLPVVAAAVVVARCVGRVRQNCSQLLPLFLSELLHLLLLPGKLQFSFACCSFSMAPNLCRGTQFADTTQTQQNPWLCLLKMQRCNHLGHSQAAPNPIRVIDNPR